MSQTHRPHRPTTNPRGIMHMALNDRIMMAVYRYKLRDGTGGTYRTGAMTVDLAIRELKRKYGKRLDVVSVERVVAA